MRLFYFACLVTWIAAIVSLCSRRDVEIHRKLSWVVTILVLNVIGAVLYFVFGPRHMAIQAASSRDIEAGIDPDAKPILPAGRSWNPIQGENRFAPGMGMNPKEGEPADGAPADRPVAPRP